MQFGIIAHIGTIDVVSILKKLQREHHAKLKRLYMCLIKKAFHRVPRKVLEWAMRKKGISHDQTNGESV